MREATPSAAMALDGDAPAPDPSDIAVRVVCDKIEGVVPTSWSD